MDDIQEHTFKAAIIEAIEKHIAAGGKITNRTFTSVDGQCPVTCLIDGEDIYDCSKGLTIKLGFPVSSKEAWSVIDGFDDIEGSIYRDLELYGFGQELRKKYLP